MVPNTLNLDPGPENRPNLDPDQDPGPDPKFCYQFCKKKIYKKVREEQLSFKAIFSFNYKSSNLYFFQFFRFIFLVSKGLACKRVNRIFNSKSPVFK